jgi:hypothetical protein
MTVDNSGNVGYFSALALGPDNTPHIVYFDEDNDRLRYTYRLPNGTWQFEIADEGGNVGTHTSIAVDHLGNVYASYYDFTAKLLKFALRNPGPVWTTMIVDGEIPALSDAELALLFSPEAPDVPNAVAASGGVGMYTSIALGADLRPHISYYDADNQRLKYAYWNGSLWVPVTVFPDRFAGMYSSLALSNQGFPYISYYDEFNRELRLALGASLPYQYYLPVTNR